MMSETIYKIKEKKDKLKDRLLQLDVLFDVKDTSSNKNNKKEKN